MTAPLSSTDIDLSLALYELELPVQGCESVSHPAGKNDHDPSAPAAWFQIGKCACSTGFRCDPAIQAFLKERASDPLLRSHCMVCGLVVPAFEIREIPL